MCLLEIPVMFSLDWIDSVVPDGIVTVGQLESAAALRKAGASSEPLAVSVHALVARASREAATDAACATPVST